MSVLNTPRGRNTATIVRAMALEWRPSARIGVVRRELERGDALAPRTATSIVRFGAKTGFPRHYHYIGEEIFVLNGVFSDESGDFGAGMYLRNPAGSSHGPYSKTGCTIFIKLLPDRAPDEANLIVDTTRMDWAAAGVEGVTGKVLFRDEHSTVTLEHLARGARYPSLARHDGEELFLLDGDARSPAFGELEPMDWIRSPAQTSSHIDTRFGATFWVKRRRAQHA